MTLTTEQLRARAKFWREKAVEAKWESVSIAQDMLLNADAFDELAANREARPVLCVDMDTDFIKHIQKCSEDVAKWPEWKRRGADVTKFTAPPAPAVPEEAKVGEMPFLGNSEPGYVRGCNDCRSAMLAQPVSSGYKLVPIEPTNKMIMAAIGVDGCSSQELKGAYQAMLAAAPEGGNG
ncbi:hypothetical protein QP585_22325 [Serratia ureilytica]|uniref:hypothetical protein n=1 Tax=Serratia ureilytica TaxID=300181 RepID=UPI00255089B0|nr:hypothetical protein [Serratia ureilytica]MDK7595852.1 hypothetical protein [Serratia ureilytica]